MTELDGYRIFHAARGELLASLVAASSTLVARLRALDLITQPAQRSLREGRLFRPARAIVLHAVSEVGI